MSKAFKAQSGMALKRLSMASVLLLGACSTLAPSYQQPETAVTPNWPAGKAYAIDQQSGVAVSQITWKDLFKEDSIKQVIGMALQNNRDLKVSVLNVERAQALLGAQRAAYFPTISADGAGSRQKLPASVTNGRATANTQYSGTVGLATYELDFFGKVRSLNDAALNTYLSTEQAQHSFQLALIADTAFAWYTLSADRARLALAQDTLKNQQTALDLIEKRFKLGVGTELDVNQARTTVESARADVARYTRLAAQDLNALNLLTAQPVPEKWLPKGELDDSTAMIDLKAGLPSEVLLRRPDVKAAEYQLKAANAKIGAARAAFFPSITLTGSYGSASNQLSNLFEAGTETWTFLPKISLPIFDGGRLQANLDVSKIDQKIAVANYQKAVETAFREVADALAAKGTLNTELQAQQNLVDASAASYKLSKARFEGGVDSYLQVLTAQQALYTAQQNLIATRLLKTSNLVTLYKVLGGSWGANS